MPYDDFVILLTTSAVGQFGDKFRKAREAKNISLDDVSNVTKIGSRMLQAIEQEHFDQLPGGVFNRGFIRAYAKHLGLNDEEAVTDYLACLRQAQIDAHEVWDPTVPPKAVAEKRLPYTKPALKVEPSVQVQEELSDLQLPKVEHVRPPTQKYLDRGQPAVPWNMVAALALVVILAGILWIRHTRNNQAQPAQTAPSSPTSASATLTPTAANSPAVASQPGSKPASNTASQQAPAPQTKPSTPPPAQASSPAKAPATAAGGQPAANKPAATNPASTNPAGKPENDVTVRNLVPAATAATPAPTMTLVIRANETSWISVTADGQLASQETLIAPAHASIRASREIVARIGNAAGVTFLWNGQEIPAQGAEAEVKTYIFDAQGMRETENTPPSQNR